MADVGGADLGAGPIGQPRPIADGEAGADPMADPYAAMAGLRRNRISLRGQLAVQERRLAEVVTHRRDTEAQIDRLRTLKARAEDQMAGLPSANRLLKQRVEMAKARLANAIRRREDGLREEDRLRAQMARAEDQLAGVAAAHRTMRLRLKEWLTGSVDALRQLFDGTSVDLDVLMARAAGAHGSGLGGPLEGIDGMREADVLGRPSGAMGERIRQLSALRKVASALPLASPLDEFELTSRFGKRRDPFTRALAFHPGLDFGATPGSRIMATAPGRVIQAGRSGPYGNLVEIDHGMGVITRYGHLKKVLVEKGDAVDVRHPIGVVGSTGRSTGRHLHYEIRIDDVAFDPARFLEAGRYLTKVTARPPTPIATGASRE